MDIVITVITIHDWNWIAGSLDIEGSKKGNCKGKCHERVRKGGFAKGSGLIMELLMKEFRVFQNRTNTAEIGKH